MQAVNSEEQAFQLGPRLQLRRRTPCKSALALGADDDATMSTPDSPISSRSSLTDDLPEVESSSLEDLSLVPAAFDLPRLLRFRADLRAVPPREGPPARPPPLPPRPPAASVMQLPDELLDLVLRYLSSRPRSPAPVWDTLRDARDAMAFACTSQRVLRLLSNRLTAIRTRPERFREDPALASTAGAVVDIRTPADVAHLASLLRLAGPALQELLITRGLPRTTWVDALEASCPAIRKLALRDVNADYPLQRVLAAVSRSLNDLEIVGATGMALSQPQLHALGTHASAVHTLALRLSMFDHDWTPVWTGLGPGLKRLSIGATRFWIMDTEEDLLLQQVGRYCPDIQHLHFYHLGPTLGPSCARLCARYGPNLTTLALEQSQLHRVDMQIIAAACINANVEITHGSSLFSHAYNVDIVDLLGPQITCLRYRSQLAHDESLWEVGRSCSNLRELRLDCASTLTEEALEAVLKKTAPTLRSLYMGFFVRGLERALASSALTHLSNYANTLQEFHIGGQRFDISPFQRLVTRCRDSLTKVSVTFGFRTAGEREVVQTDAIVQVIQAVYPCHKLVSLIILDRTSTDTRSDDAEIRQACFPFRGRVQRISVCGVNYVI